MIKPAPSKKDTRTEINAQVDAFLRSKGEIKQAQMGETGLVDGKYNMSHVGFDEPKKTRTPLNHVVAAMQKRKNKPNAVVNVRRQRPKKTVIYDDFGEPLRWVWEE